MLYQIPNSEQLTANSLCSTICSNYPSSFLATKKMGPYWHRTLAYLVLTGMVLQHVPVALAQNNEFQPFHIPNPNPGSWDDVERVVKQGADNDPDQNIHANLQEAMCGGWDFELQVNGVFEQQESYFVKGEEFQTDPSEGLVAKATGVPGRDTVSAYGNGNSGLGVRREFGGNAPDVAFSPAAERRVLTGTSSGFDYPTAGTCGLSTLCRPPSHPDRRSPPVYQNHGLRDQAQFFCDHPCQRPLDDPGKPEGWDPTDSTSVRCGVQQPYEPQEDQVKYSCGGKETKGPGEDFCGELNQNGQLGGLCQDINNWVYIRWTKMVHICLTPTFTPVPIFLNEKGPCGFPAEADQSEHSQNKRADNWIEAGVFECCSDSPFPGGKEYSFTHKGLSCKPCNGADCRLDPETHEVIKNDVWLEPFPADLPGSCLVGLPNDPETISTLIDALGGMGLDPGNLGVNIGAWPNPDQNLRKEVQNREYLSYFREYENAGYERADMEDYLPEDDHKKENIPVACYGMYDLAPENARIEETAAEDKRCVIAAYYETDDGDGDEVNFWSMADTQRGRGAFNPGVRDNPFGDSPREFNEEQDLWFPQLGTAFSLLNQRVFEDRFNEDFSFALLTTDSARQRTTVQLDPKRRLSSGALIRTFDDTVDPNRVVDDNDEEEASDFGPEDLGLTRERRTFVEWWHTVETAMHKNFTPPTVRLLLPTTWSVDINPLDPIYTPKTKDKPAEDIQSEAIEIQVQADEDLLGEIASFMERNLLLRVDSEPIPVVVPMVNPTELRAWAHGWQSWAQKQEDEGGPGADRAREVADKLLEYADQADNVRKLRGELPKYAARLLHEQAKISNKIARWLTDNIDAYRQYMILKFGNQLLSQQWQFVQQTYRSTTDNDAFPWCRNTRFTSPVYSMLDPWLPGRENEGDVTAGLLSGEYSLTNYLDCEFFVFNRRQEDPTLYPSNDVCDEFLPPLPPELPQLPDTRRDPDIVLDFTAFREVQKSVMLPVLKPVQIRMDFDSVRPPGLEDREEPEYPELSDLPELPESISDAALDSIPEVVIPGGDDFDLFKEASVLAATEDDPEDEFPKIEVPKLDLLSLARFLQETMILVRQMTEEYDLFWNSIIQEKCEDGESEDCVRPNTEQDCVLPHDDPNGRCVHFEADLKERLQRIGSRGAIFLIEDFISIGKFRDPLIYGQEICEQEDWACQLLNRYSRKPRDGWQLDISDEYDPDALMQELRQQVRDESSNILTNPEDRFLFDIDQNQIFENFRVPEGERIERYIERFEPPEE